MMNILSDQYSEGWESYDNGNRAFLNALSDNQYKAWTLEWISWNRGWNEAKDSW